MTRTGAGLLDVVLDLPELTDAEVLEVHDRATRLNERALELGADGQAIPHEALVLDHERLQLTLRRRDRVQFREIQLAELLDVDGSSVLVLSARYASARTYLVRLVVESGVQLGHLRLLGVVERLVELVDLVGLAPFLSIDPHDLGLREVELARAEESSTARQGRREAAATHKHVASSCFAGS